MRLIHIDFWRFFVSQYIPKCFFVALFIGGAGHHVSAQNVLDGQATSTSIQSNQQNIERIEIDAITIDSGLEKRRSDLITAPGSLAVKDRKSIETTPNANLSDVLETEPNVRFYGGPRAGAQLPQIRGMQSERILILEEGVRQNYQSQHTGRVFTDFSMIESVEVVKGPWSSLYGSGAMGGVISYRRATAGDYLHRANINKSKYFGSEVSFDSGTAADNFGQRLTAFGRLKKWEPLFSYRESNSEDIRLSSGENLQYSANQTQDFYTSQSVSLSQRQILNVKLNRYSDKGRIPLNPNLNQVNNNQIGDSTVIKQDIVAEYQYKGELADIHLKPFVRESEIRRIRVSDRRNDTQSVITQGVDTWATLDKIWSERIKSNITLGVEAFYDENKGSRNKAELKSFPNGSSQQTGLYLQPTVSINEKWTVTPGARFDSYKNTSDTSGMDTNSGEDLSSKLYTNYEYIPEKNIFVGWGEAFNAPRLQDIYLTDMHFPGNFFVPNPDLKPENSYTTEVGTKNIFRINEVSAVTADVTLFQTRSRDFISRDVKATTTQLKNLDSVELKGYEASLGWQGISSSLKLGYGQVRSQDLSTNQPLGDTPADQWSVTFDKYVGDNLQLGTEVIYTESQGEIPLILSPGDIPVNKTGGYAVQNIFAQYRTKKGLSFNGRLNNIWDKEYKPHGENIVQVGRDMRYGFSWLF